MITALYVLKRLPCVNIVIIIIIIVLTIPRNQCKVDEEEDRNTDVTLGNVGLKKTL